MDQEWNIRLVFKVRSFQHPLHGFDDYHLRLSQGSTPSLKVKVRFQYNIAVLKGDNK
jgi:hypothetical protein